MIKVECVSCKSPYDVDERRVPDLGMKMRCPKCGTSFLVHKDGSSSAVAATAAGTGPVAPPIATPGTGLPPPAAFKSTLVGQQAPVAPPAPQPAVGKSTMLGMPAGALAPPVAPPRAASIDVADLPALKPPPKPAVPFGSLAPPAPMSRAAAPTALPKGAIAPPSGSFGGAPSQGASAPKAGGAATAFGAVAPAAPPAPVSGLARTMIGAAAPGSDAGADLPALKASSALPAASFGGGSGATPAHDTLDFGGVDLPAPKMSVDLPAPRKPAAASAGFGEVDLPAPKMTVDLPAPKAAASGGSDFGMIDLPAPKAGFADLPAPKAGFADLPAPRGAADLPVAKGGFGELDLPVPKAKSDHDEASFGDIELPDLPAALGGPPSNAGFGGIQLPPPKAAAVIAPKEPTYQGGVGLRARPNTEDETSFGDLNARNNSLPPSLMGGDDESSFGDLNVGDDLVSIPSTPPSLGGLGQSGTSIPPALLGEDSGLEEPMADGDLLEESEDLGESDLGEADLPSDGGEESEEDMEFGIAGGEGEEGFALPPEMLRRQRGEDAEAVEARRSKRAVHIVAAVAVVLVVLGGVGAGLGLTDHGFFGIYYLERYLPEAGDPAFTRDAIARAEKTASSDTYRDVRKALVLLGEARHKRGLNRELLTRSLMHESLYQVRFGADTKSASHSAALALRLQERHNIAPGIDLALAADAARRQAWGDVGSLLRKALAQSPNDPYVDLIGGEAGLRQGKLAEAEKAFHQALKHGGGARAQWGLARVALARTDQAAQLAAVEETLKLSPMHAEALIALGRLQWLQGKEDKAILALRQALGLEPMQDTFIAASKLAQAQGYGVLGYIHEARGRLAKARQSYKAALDADPYLVEGLLGAGRVMLREKRNNDALARFEAALNTAQKGSNPIVLSGRKADVEARLGQARAMLALSRGPDARGVLTELLKEHPSDAEMVLVMGQVEDLLSKKKEVAEGLFRKSIELAPTSFAGYLALAQLYFKLSQPDRASDTLNEAAAKVEESAEMRRMLGTSELARNRLDNAVHQFRRAVELDPQDLDAKFGLATSLRKTGKLAEAASLLDEITARDAQYPNMALERGQLLEAEGAYVKATEAYKAALEKDSTDTSLKLRLGASQVEAGLLDDAEQTLAQVIREVPNSAEAEYFIGRIAFARSRGPDALAHFDRALALDNTQALYHLYAARTALSMRNLGRAMEEVNLTLDRDASVGDAYWVRGVVRLQTGHVKDALKDLLKALELKPSRYEAWASIGECYDQLRMLPESVKAFRTALESDPKHGEWWYKLGRVHVDAGEPTTANGALAKAMEIGDAMDPLPLWLPDVYRLSAEIARNANNKKSATALYLRYLAIAPDGAVDRKEIRTLLLSWGVELER